MKAQKVTLKIEVETLSIDSVRGMLIEVVDSIERETVSGMIRKSDGDEIRWEKEEKPVEI